MVLFGIGGGAAFVGVRKNVYADFDRDLRTKAGTVASLVELDDDNGIEFDFRGEFMPEFGAGERPEYFQMWVGSDVVQARSSSLGSKDLERPEPSWGTGECRPIVLPDGRPGRATLLRFIPRVDPDRVKGQLKIMVRRGADHVDATKPQLPPPEMMLVVAKGTETVRASLARFVVGFALGTGVLIGLSMHVIRRTVRSSLRPVGELAGAMAAIGARSLGRRHDPARIAELQPIVDTLNGLLMRLESAFERERRFTSSAAHELKNPIAELRTMAEVAQRWPSDPDVAATTFGELVELAKQMERTVSTLLSIARAESGLPVAGVSRPTAVAELVARIWAQLERRAAERFLAFERELEGALLLETDPVLLERILMNLLENAVEYSPPGGRIRVWHEGPPGRDVTLVVANTTNGDLDGESLQHFFEPFWRSNPTHESGGGHVGLGLSLVKALCEALGGRVSAEIVEHELRFSIDLPGAGGGVGRGGESDPRPLSRAPVLP